MVTLKDREGVQVGLVGHESLDELVLRVHDQRPHDAVDLADVLKLFNVFFALSSGQFLPKDLFLFVKSPEQSPQPFFLNR